MSATPWVMACEVRARPPDSRCHQERFSSSSAVGAGFSGASSATGSAPLPNNLENMPRFLDPSSVLMHPPSGAMPTPLKDKGLAGRVGDWRARDKRPGDSLFLPPPYLNSAEGSRCGGVIVV